MKCTRCKLDKPESEFCRTKNRKRGQCKQCETDLHLEWGRTHIKTVMIYSAKHRAKRDGVPFRITQDDFEIPEFCPILGHRLEAGTRQHHEYAPTIDKIEPGLGYIPGNIRVISHRANLLKSDATMEELHLLYQDAAKITDSKYAALRVPQSSSLHPRFRQGKFEASIS